MTGTTQLYHHSRQWFAQFGIASSCALLLLLGGCAGHKVKAKPFPWSTFAYARPLAPSSSPDQIDESDNPLGNATLDIAPPPSALAIPRSVPSRPRLPAGNSPPSDAASKPEVPQIAPQLTAAETSAAQQQTGQSLNVAERNIASADGKTLNAMQQDLASKVRSFMAEAAKKAEVLSQELASSL